MSLDFMVLAGPRSGTTWAANWLTTDTTICMHDPLLEYTMLQVDRLGIPTKRLGISCTSSLRHPKWVLAHESTRKVILWREPDEFNASLEKLGLPTIGKDAFTQSIKTVMDADKKIEIFDWEGLFVQSTARRIWNILMPHKEFDPYRHDQLMQMNIQPQWRNLRLDKDAVGDLVKRAKEVLQ